MIHEMQSASQEEKDIDNTDYKPKNSLFKWFIVVVVLILLAITSIVYLQLSGSKEKTAVNKPASDFVSSLVNNNSSEAYTLTSKGFKLRTTEDQLKRYFSKLNNVLGGGQIKLQDMAIEKSTTSGQNAVVTFTITKAGKKLYAKVMLIKEDNKWRITNFATNENKLEAKIE